MVWRETAPDRSPSGFLGLTKGGSRKPLPWHLKQAPLDPPKRVAFRVRFHPPFWATKNVGQRLLQPFQPFQCPPEPTCDYARLRNFPQIGEFHRLKNDTNGETVPPQSAARNWPQKPPQKGFQNHPRKTPQSDPLGIPKCALLAGGSGVILPGLSMGEASVRCSGLGGRRRQVAVPPTSDITLGSESSVAKFRFR